MFIIHKYIIKEIARYFFLVLISVLGIYIVVDFFEKIDNFLAADIGFVKAAAFLLYQIPSVISQVLPVCLLLAVLITLGLMNKQNEMVALKSGGVSIHFLLQPVMLMGIGFTLVLFILSEIIVPLTVPEANRIWLEDVKKKQMVTTREKNIWIKGDRLIVHIKYFNPVKKTVFGLSLYYFDKQFNLLKRIDAEKGTFSEEHWQLENIMEQILDKEKDRFQTRLIDKRKISLPITPEDLQKVKTKSEEMNVIQLNAYIQKVELEGYDATIYKVDYFGKFAFPFVCVILSLLGTGGAVKRSMKEGLPLGVAYGLGIAFLYWVFYSFCMSLGYGGLIPPVLSAWMANLIFLCWGVYVLLNPQ